MQFIGKLVWVSLHGLQLLVCRSMLPQNKLVIGYLYYKAILHNYRYLLNLDP